jgi:hypothetical protein
MVNDVCSTFVDGNWVPAHAGSDCTKKVARVPGPVEAFSNGTSWMTLWPSLVTANLCAQVVSLPVPVAMGVIVPDASMWNVRQAALSVDTPLPLASVTWNAKS